MELFDTIIIGGGPAGLSAGIYAMRSRLNTVMLEKYVPGGQMVVTDFVENYPGFPTGIGGIDLGIAMEQQARGLGLDIRSTEVLSVDFSGEEKIINTSDGEMRALTVILATGATPRKLNVPGEERYTGKGVSYCATCDGAFFRDKDIVVVGGGNTAIQDAVFLTRFASSVKIVHRRDALRATKIIQERAMKNDKIEFIWNSVLKEIDGKNTVEKVVVFNVETKEESSFPVDGVFVLIGTDPNTSFLEGHIVLDPSGYILTDEEMRTSIHGVYAAGDCRHKGLRQMVTAAADGAIAAVEAEQYIESLSDRML